MKIKYTKSVLRGAIQILREARRLVEDGWIKGEYERKEALGEDFAAGKKCDTKGLCLLGALSKAVTGNAYNYDDLTAMGYTPIKADFIEATAEDRVSTFQLERMAAEGIGIDDQLAYSALMETTYAAYVRQMKRAGEKPEPFDEFAIPNFNDNDPTTKKQALKAIDKAIAKLEKKLAAMPTRARKRALQAVAA